MERGLLSFKDLILGDRIFQIPIYQRNYAWENQQLEDLWNDIIYLDVNKKHFFGTILLKDTNEEKEILLKNYKIYHIIDGQQRLSTILIFIKVIINELKKLKDKELIYEIEEIEKNYLKNKDIYKLELLNDDKHVFNDYIINDKIYPDDILTQSQRRLKNAKIFFTNKINELALNRNEYRDFLITLKNKIDNLEIIRYTVSEDSDAVLIFETVNNRGKPLSELEKTKSFFMHMVYLTNSDDPQPILDKLNNLFARIFQHYEKISSNPRGEYLNESSIQRYHFVIYEADGNREISYNYLDYLKNKLRQDYRDGKNNKCINYIIKYTEDLEKGFFALKEIIEKDRSDDLGIYLDKLFKLERLAPFYPLLIASWIRFNKNENILMKILELIEKYSFRVYSIGRRRSDTGEPRLYSMANRLYTKNMDYKELLKEIKNRIIRYENNDKFIEDLKDIDFYHRINTRDKKHILIEYEMHLRDKMGENLKVDYEKIFSDAFQIEHIWAQNPKNLKDELIDIHYNNVDKLGNLTLASTEWNQKWGNKSFQIKKKRYANSSLKIQRDLRRYKKWNEKTIRKRENNILIFAKERWKVG